MDPREERIDRRGETIEVFVAIILVDAAAEIALGRGVDDDGHASLQVVALGAHGGLLRIHAAHLAAVVLEDLDGGSHFADLVVAAEIGDFRVQISIGHRIHHL
ncbi:hypothetical protein D3C78_1645220 [compost metagenome]